MNCRRIVQLTVLAFLAGAPSAFADGKSKAATELFEYVGKKFGKEAIKDGAEVFGKRFAAQSVKHGEAVIVSAVKRSGPQALHAIEEAGEHGGKLAKLIVSHGDDAIICVAKRAKAMELLAKHGESAGVVLCKHKGIAEPLIEKLGEPAVHALAEVGPRNGRRLAIMMESGDLAKIGRTAKLLNTIEKYGEKGANFVWEHKGALTVGAVLTAFLADPEPYINGTKELLAPMAAAPAKVVESVFTPLAQGPVSAMGDVVARPTNWKALLGLLTVGGMGVVALRFLRGQRGTSVLRIEGVAK